MRLTNTKILYIVGGIVIIYLIYVLARCNKKPENYLQFSQGDEVDLLNRLEGFKGGFNNNRMEDYYEDVSADAPNGLPFVQSAGTGGGFGRYGSSFIV